MATVEDKTEYKPEEETKEVIPEVSTLTEEVKPVKNARGAGRKKGSKNHEESKAVRVIRKETANQVTAIEEPTNKIKAQHVLDYLHENILPKLETVG